MLKIPAYGGLKKVLWKDLEPGMIIQGGVMINNGLPIELVQFPSLTITLIYQLTQKYHFRPNKEVIVAVPKKGESAIKMSFGFRDLETNLKKFNEFRAKFLEQKVNILRELKEKEDPSLVLSSSHLIDKGLRRKGNMNSSDFKPYSEIPSFIKKLDIKILNTDVLGNRVNDKLNLPDDLAIQLFLGLGYSENFKSNLVSEMNALLDYFFTYFNQFLKNTKVHLLGVSNTCEKIQYPLGGRELENGNVNYSPFFKKCLHLKNKDTENMAILIVDKSCFDLAEAMETGEKLKKNGIDFNIIYYSKEVSDDDRKKLMHVSESCNANLFVFSELKLLPLLTIEALDHFLGLKTLSKRPTPEPVFAEFTKKPINQKPIEKPITNPEPEIKEKVIKPFEFKRISKKDL